MNTKLKNDSIAESTSTTIQIKDNGVYVKNEFNDHAVTTYLIPEIDSIRVSGKYVITIFKDGSEKRSIFNPENPLVLDKEISVCIMKKILGNSNLYNRLIKYAMKCYKETIAKQSIKETGEENKNLKKKERKVLMEEHTKQESQNKNEDDSYIVICSECGRKFILYDKSQYRYFIRTRIGHTDRKEYQCGYTCWDHALLRYHRDKGLSAETYKQYVTRSEELMKIQKKDILHPITLNFKVIG